LLTRKFLRTEEICKQIRNQETAMYWYHYFEH